MEKERRLGLIFENNQLVIRLDGIQVTSISIEEMNNGNKSNETTTTNKNNTNSTYVFRKYYENGKSFEWENSHIIFKYVIG